MLYRNAGKPAVSGDLAKFSDASAVASWASDAMLWAVSEGLVKGSGSNLNPTATADPRTGRHHSVSPDGRIKQFSFPMPSAQLARRAFCIPCTGSCF